MSQKTSNSSKAKKRKLNEELKYGTNNFPLYLRFEISEEDEQKYL